MKAVVTGATGFIGRSLCRELDRAGHDVVAFVRDLDRGRKALGEKTDCVVWDGKAGGAWEKALDGSDVVFHLAGESIGGQRWTPEIKERMRASRVGTTRALVDAMSKAGSKPSAFVCASAVGYYGERGDETVTEKTPPGSDFLSEMCVQWEQEAERVAEAGVRVARMRLGVVLGGGGALQKMLYPLPIPISPWKLGLGGPLGSGRQWFPWVHLDDVVELFLWVAANPAASGPFNVSSPLPVTNRRFARAIGGALHRPAVLPVPAFVLKAVLGEFSSSLLVSQKVLPVAAEKLGYSFKFPDVDAALRVLLDPSFHSGK